MFASAMETLVLSMAYEPMYRVGWREAMLLWIGGRAEVIEAYEDRVIHTVRQSFPLPSIIRFHRARRRFRAELKFSRENVYLRDGGQCQYCGEAVPKRSATYDHVVPRSHGGPTDWENIVLACLPCNQTKANRTPEQAGMLLARPPIRPRSLPATSAVLGYERDMPPSWRPFLDRDAAL